MNEQALESKKLEILQEQLTVHRAQDKRAGMLLQFAMILTGLLYFMFEKHLFLGDAVTWGSYFETWHGAADFVLMFVIVVMSAVFLAWVKHHAYLHFGLYGSIGLIVVTVIGFALFAEFFSSSASQDTKSRVLLSNDAAYQATIAQPNTAPTQFIGGSSSEIAKAEQVYARCMKNLGKPGYKHCDGDKAKLDSLKAQEATRLQIAKDVAVESNIETEKLRNERQDKLKADSYNPVIVSIAKGLSVFGGSYTDYIKMATVLVTLIVAIAFEILHHFLSHAKERAQNAVYGLELELAKYQGSAIPEKPESVIPRNDGGFKSSGIGFTAPIGNTAKYDDSGSHSVPIGKADIDTTIPLFKYQEKPQEVKKQPFGFVPDRPATTAKLEPDTATLRDSGGFRQSPEQLQRVHDLAADTTGQTWREALKAGDRTARDMPLDAPIHPQARTSSEPQATGSPATSRHPQAGGGDNLKLEGIKVQPQAKAIQVPDGLYAAWVRAVNAGECLPSLKGAWGWIQKQIAGNQQAKMTFNNREIGAIAQAFFLRAVKDGYATINPKYTNPKCGLSKYLWSN